MRLMMISDRHHENPGPRFRKFVPMCNVRVTCCLARPDVRAFLAKLLASIAAVMDFKEMLDSFGLLMNALAPKQN